MFLIVFTDINGLETIRGPFRSLQIAKETVVKEVNNVFLGMDHTDIIPIFHTDGTAELDEIGIWKIKEKV